MKYLIFALVSLGLLAGCTKQKERADLLVHNATVYTADSSFTVADAFVIRDGKILKTGNYTDLTSEYLPLKTIDAEGKYIYPGFNDGHTHFFRYGMGLQTVDLTGTKSWQEVIDRVNAYAQINKEGWIIGRGWDQNDWPRQEFPDNLVLNRLFPGRPVILTRIDGHAALVNQVALDSAGIRPGQVIAGGVIGMKGRALSGLLVDNAVSLVSSHIPQPTIRQMDDGLLAAQKNCFAAGLTSVTDCGLNYQMISVIDALQQDKSLKMRINVMLSDNQQNYDYLFKNGAFSSEKLTVKSFKVYADGALGSRGACLLQDYSDRPGNRGFLLSSQEHFADMARKIYEKGFQMCTHAIGDSANRVILKIYASVLKGKNDRRWRIEHAQVINEKDFDIFHENSIVPSVQPTHATSDMYWAGARLGKDRLKGAYAFKRLMNENGWLVLGTDFPVENIEPLLTFYAAVARKDPPGFPSGGFQPENALSRKDALRGMTIWPAKGSFEEKLKGSIEPGKFADFVILNQDIMKVPVSKILKTKVLKTYSNGEQVYAR